MQKWYSGFDFCLVTCDSSGQSADCRYEGKPRGRGANVITKNTRPFYSRVEKNFKPIYICNVEFLISDWTHSKMLQSCVPSQSQQSSF